MGMWVKHKGASLGCPLVLFKASLRQLSQLGWVVLVSVCLYDHPACAGAVVLLGQRRVVTGLSPGLTGNMVLSCAYRVLANVH